MFCWKSSITVVDITLPAMLPVTNNRKKPLPKGLNRGNQISIDTYLHQALTTNPHCLIGSKSSPGGWRALAFPVRRLNWRPHAPKLSTTCILTMRKSAKWWLYRRNYCKFMMLLTNCVRTCTNILSRKLNHQIYLRKSTLKWRPTNLHSGTPSSKLTV